MPEVPCQNRARFGIEKLSSMFFLYEFGMSLPANDGTR